MSFQVGDMVGEYRIVGLLGSGGMGKVYKAKHQISDREDALKVLLPDLANDPDLENRFTREIKVLASMNHPNIAGLRTAFRLDNQLLMVMEYVEGTSLDNRLKAGPVSCGDAINYIRQVLAALAYAHKRGVIHRDIKPANMMLTPENTIKLMDFGIAKSKTESKLTQTGATLGSLSYMSPEQVQGEELDGRSDLYSVGVSLYELVTGSKPFQGKSDFEIMMAHLQQSPVPPILRLPNLPFALNDIIMNSLEKDPSRRFQTAEAFSVRLKNILPGLGLTAAEAAGDEGLVESLPTVVPSSRVPAALSAEVPLAELRAAVRASQPKARSWIKLAVPLAVGAVLIASLVVVLRRGKREDVTTTVVPPPPTPAFVHLASGDMVLVAAGDALLGKDLRRTPVEGFYIDKTEVNNHAWLDFGQATGHALPLTSGQTPGDYPVVNVTFDDARSFCGWAGKRLPKADEWEKAARGASGQPFPWGASFDASLANIPHDDAAAATAKLAPATAYEGGKSPYGALNMLGNAWEWVDAVAPAPEGPEFTYYQRTLFRDLKPPLSATEPFYYARGGSYKFFDPNPAELISDPGSPLPARARKPDVGFRCAMDVKK